MSVSPLESNPDVMNKFIHLLGVPEKWNLVDVFGLDSESLNWVPRPVLALILLFPCNEQFYEFAKKEKEELEAKGQEISDQVFYMKQYVSNACGTIALIHSVANNADTIQLNEGIFKNLLSEWKDLDPEQRGQLFKDPGDSEAAKLINLHQELAKEGQTALNPEEKVNHHFVALIHKDGHLYELDGSKEFPINHGPTSEDNFLEDAANVCKKFIERDSEDVNFTVLALTASE